MVCGRTVGRAGHQNNPPAQSSPQTPGHLVAIQAGQTDVHDGNVRLPGQSLAQPPQTVLGDLDLVAPHLQ